MHKIDSQQPLDEQYGSIDFTTFQCGDEYVIARVYRREKEYLKAHIDYFRHGIAIAHKGNRDCLINTRCEIIFEETASSRRSGINICRAFEGFKIMWEEDVAAPGKDFDWRPKEVIIPEHRIAANAYEHYNAKIYEYPYDITPPERGLIIRFGNKFYDFETYDYLYTIPNTVQFFTECTRYNLYNVYSDRDYDNKPSVQVYKKDDFDAYIVKDAQYYRNIIVKVHDHKIISWYPLPCIEEEPLRDISYQNYSEDLGTNPLDSLNADKYIQYIFSDDKIELNPHIDKTFNIFTQFPELREAFDTFHAKQSQIFRKTGKEYVGVIRGSNVYLVVRFIYNGFIICNYDDYPCYSSYKRRDLSKFYVFNDRGNILNLTGYDEIDVVQSNVHSEELMFNRKNEYGIACIGTYNSNNIELREKVLFIYDEDDVKYKDIRIKPSVGIGITCGNPECRFLKQILIDDKFYIRDIEREKASAIGIYKWETIGISFREDFSDSVLYAGIPYPLSKIEVDDELRLAPIIDDYLYKLPNNSLVSKYIPIRDNVLYREYMHTMYSIDTIKQATQTSIEKTRKRLEECCKKGNPYVVRIKEIKKFSNSYTQYYLFEYRPYGKIDSKGNITYLSGAPDKIEL